MSVPAAPTPLRVLNVEDEEAFTELIRRSLENEGFAITIERVVTKIELEAALDRQPWDVVISDHSIPGFDSHNALRSVTSRQLDVPFIIVSGYIGEEAAVAAMRAGAHDYVPKASLGRLGVAVRSALQNAAERATLRQRERDLEALHAVAFAAGKALDADRLADFANDRARELLRCDYSALYWWNTDLNALERISSSAASPDHGVSVMRTGEGVAGSAFGKREAVVVDDYPTWPDRLPGGLQRSLASAMATPLFIGDRAMGALIVGSQVKRRFAPEEVRVLSLLAAEVAPAIETGHLLAAAQHAAHYDELTGLPNRALFTQRLTQQIKACTRDDKTFTLLFADLDDFRQINDAFGHGAGDTVLRELGVRLRQVQGIGDAVGRFGADEFAVLFPAGTGLQQARAAAEQAVAFLKAPFMVSDQPVHLAASMGIVAFPEHGREADVLLQRAETAMFAAKRSQTRYRIYTVDLDPQSQKRIALATELREALRNNELVLHYQPQVECTEDGPIVGAEALLRWAHPRRGLVAPMEFIPFAEQSGLIVEITPWVVRAALDQVRAWRARGLDLRVSVNVAMRNLRDPNFFSEIETIIARSGLPPAVLTLEITEGTIMLEAERTLDQLQKFHTLGVGVSIDDFGTGYSSLSYLSKLPVDEIKIDKSFVMALEAPGNKAIVEAIIKLGEAFGLRIVAEGVADHAAWTTITALGCSIAQGYHMSPPLAADQLEEWVKTRRSSTLGPRGVLR